jgi:hypothetical protein
MNGSTVVIGNRQRVTTSSGWIVSGLPTLYFEYLSRSSREAVSSIPMIHLESIALPYPAVYVFTVSRIIGEQLVFEREVEFNGSCSRGCAFSVSSIGNYSVEFRSTDPEFAGRFLHGGSQSFAAAEPSDNFYSDVQLLSTTHRPSSTPRPSPTATSSPPPSLTASASPLPSLTPIRSPVPSITPEATAPPSPTAFFTTHSRVPNRRLGILVKCRAFVFFYDAR